MLRLRIAAEPHWVELSPGLRVQVRPFTTGIMTAAEALIRKWGAGDDLTTRSGQIVRAVAVVAILDWEGVGDADGNAAAVTEANVLALMDVYLPALRFEAEYIVPGMLIGAEKKGCAPLPNGGLAGAPNTAATAPESVTTANATTTPPKPSRAG